MKHGLRWLLYPVWIAALIFSPRANAQSQPAAPDAAGGTLAASPVAQTTYRPAFIQGHKGLSLHKDIYILPLSWAQRYQGNNTELIFQISTKIQLLDMDLYFGYTQKSYWQAYNQRVSSPFRETDYNPEFFYRLAPEHLGLLGWGGDIGIEHQSNGQPEPLSRGWNRVYVAPYYPRGDDLFYFKFWYRIPEPDKRFPLDPNGDDNPDISDYMGYAELHYRRRIGDDQRLHIMLRGNPETRRGAISISYSIPSGTQDLFYRFTFFNGFGESLIDYNRSVTRVGVGVAFLR